MSALADKIKHEAEEAARKAERWQKMAELVDELGEEGIAEFAALIRKNGNGKPGADKEPIGRTAIRRLVGERPGLWSMDEFKKEMREHGWFTSARAVENAVLRMVADGEGRRIARGRYVFPADHEEEVARESDPSGAKIPLAFSLK